MRTHPRIGVPARLSSAASAGDQRVAIAAELFEQVLELLRSRGLDPVVIEDEGEDLGDFDGFVVPGGGDIDPALYGAAASDALYDVDPAQDALDLAVIRAAEAGARPLLAICRGAQLLNVHRGGTLHVDLAPTGVAHRHVADGPEDTESLFVWHPVELEPGSELAAAHGSAPLLVTSGHHQGIHDVGAGLVVVARADDALVEAVAGAAPGHWVLGVQWHPEVPGRDAEAQQLPVELFRRALLAG